MQQCKHWAGCPTCLPHQPVHDSGELEGLTYSAYTSEESSARIFTLHRLKETNKKLQSSVNFQLTTSKISWKSRQVLGPRPLARGLKLLTADKQLINDDHLMGSHVWHVEGVEYSHGALLEICIVSFCVPMTWLERSWQLQAFCITLSWF